MRPDSLPRLWRYNLTLDLSSSCIQMGALSHTLTPFCSVCHQFFGFIPGDVHVLQISSNDVHLTFPWPSRLSLVAPQLPLYSLTRYSGVLHSHYVSQPPQSSFFNYELQFLQPSLPPDLSSLHLRFKRSFVLCALRSFPTAISEDFCDDFIDI